MNSSADIHFNSDGVPVSNQFDDIYFSVDSGIDESQYVFLQQNGLPEAFRQLPSHYEFVVAETGFGTGLNFLLCWQAFLANAPASCRLVFVSFEKFPLSLQQLQQAYQALPSLQRLCAELIDNYPSPEPGCHRLLLADGRVTLDLWLGDINTSLPDFGQQAKAQVDRWFLDGFAPSKNPDMWQSTLFDTMAMTAHQGTRYATFTAAGVVKRGLQQVGFGINKVKGFGRKREMLCGQAQQQALPIKAPLKTTPVTIVGAGIAAATLALALSRRGVSVTVNSRGLADGASGNPQGAVYPLLHAEQTPLSQFYLQAFSTAVSTYLPWRNSLWFNHGVLQPAFNEQRQQRAAKIAAVHYAQQTVTVQTAAALNAGLTIGTAALHYPNAGWLRPASMVSALFNAAGVTINPITVDASQLQSAEVVVIAAGHASAQLVETATGQRPAINPVRGQITQVKANAASQQLTKVLCYKGYMIPADHGVHCIGATFNRGDASDEVRAADDEENLNSLKHCAAQPWTETLTVVNHRASVRATTPDHQPMVGQVKDNLYLFSGLGSRGLTSAPLLAEILAAQLTHGLQPLSGEARKRLAPR